MGHDHSHFGEKEAIAHVAERHAQGMLEGAEVHGTEIPGHLSAATDAAKETAIVVVTVWALLINLNIPSLQIFEVLGVFAMAWLVWKSGRSAWLGWARLERLHRVLAQEKWEIDHHRGQEREELVVLYSAKGFEGKLLDDVVDTLMADGDRLLKVMIEEEMGLSLESQEHPIKQAFGAAIGTVFATIFCGVGHYLYPSWGIFIASLVVIAIAASVSAIYERNRVVPAIVWNLGIAVLTFGTVYYLIEFFFE
jgi:vacuolar iron transporter family protein